MKASSTIFKSLVSLDLGLNPGLPDHWRTLYPLANEPKYNVLILGRDINVQIGKNVYNKFSLHKLSNRNGLLTRKWINML